MKLKRIEYRLVPVKGKTQTWTITASQFDPSFWRYNERSFVTWLKMLRAKRTA